jgi:hypothetical protein
MADIFSCPSGNGTSLLNGEGNMTEKLIRQCICLPNDEKAYLIRMMQDTMKDEREDDGSRFHLLWKAATKVVGGGIISRSKLRKPVIGRMLIVYKMWQEGYKLESIGEYLKRKRVSIRHLRNNMDDVLAYPKMYAYEMECWKKFNELVKEYEKEV